MSNGQRSYQRLRVRCRLGLGLVAGTLLTVGATGCDQIGKDRALIAPTEPNATQPSATALPGAPPQAVPAPAAGRPGATLLRQLSDAVAAVAAQTRPAVVFVSVVKPDGPGLVGPPSGPTLPGDLRELFERFFELRQRGEGSGLGGGRDPAPRHLQGVGSGFLVDLANGYIVTSNHVVEGADEISVRLPTGATSAAKVVGRDGFTDLAVVQLADPHLVKTKLAALQFADSDKVRVGDFALAVGAPFGLEASLSFGVVSATGRGSLGIAPIGDFLQTDAAINPGNSGGPLLDSGGQVIGVNTAIYSQTGAYAGIGFAVPANMARLVTSRLIAKGKVDRGYLGLALQPLTPDLRTSLKVPEGEDGAVVADVAPVSPAASAGVHLGDVVTAVNGKPLHGEAELVNLVGLMEPGQSAQLRLWRGGQAVTANVTVGAWPVAGTRVATAPAPAAAGAGQQAAFGLTLAPLTAELKARLRSVSDAGAVVLRAEAQAARAGLAEGDIIVAVGSEPVKEPADFARLTQGSDRPLLRAERSGTFFFTVLSRTMPGAAETSH